MFLLAILSLVPSLTNAPSPYLLTLFRIVSRGPGFWKLNTTILSEPDYVNEISTFWSSWKNVKDSSASLLDWWDLGKVKIKSLTIDYCRLCSALRKARFELLCDKAAQLKFLVNQGHVSTLSDYKTALSELNQFSLDRARGAQVRSRSRWLEEGESSTAYFFCLERKRKPDGTISSLKRLSRREPCKRCYSLHHRFGSNFLCRLNLVKY